MMLRTLAVLLLCWHLPAFTAEDSTPPEAGKVLKLEAGGGTMLVDAETDWAGYTGIQLEKATVEFREGWVRDQERLNNSTLRETDLTGIRKDMSEMLNDVLTEAVADSENYSLSDTQGTGTLRFTPRIVKLDINAPVRIQAIVGNVLVDSKGSLVPVVDISDSESGELLASAWRLEIDPDKGFMDTATDAANRTAFKRMMLGWSDWLFAMLDHVRTGETAEES